MSPEKHQACETSEHTQEYEQNLHEFVKNGLVRKILLPRTSITELPLNDLSALLSPEELEQRNRALAQLARQTRQIPPNLGVN